MAASECWKRHGNTFSPGAFAKEYSRAHLDFSAHFGYLPSGSVRCSICIVLSNRICDNLLEKENTSSAAQPSEPRTPMLTINECVEMSLESSFEKTYISLLPLFWAF